MITPFVAGKHPRAAGGLFAASSAASGKPSGAWTSGPLRKGSGKKGTRDARAVAAQRQLNALGFGDERGRPLVVDGIDGAHTTAAVKRWQAAHGQAQTGELDAKAMVALLSEKPKSKPPATARARMRAGTSQQRHASPSKPAAAKPTAVTPKPFADRGRGFSRTGPNAST